MLGHITALTNLKPDKEVLVVACGAGVTAGSFVPYPAIAGAEGSVKRIVICDIEPLVPPMVAKKWFGDANHHVIEDARTRVIEDDGRHYIRTTKDKFDIITSDPIDPWVKGCAALNTVEYYQMCKDHLKPGGVVALWIPLYENSQESINSVITTFFKVFPNGILWSNDETPGSGYDAVLFGQAEPTKIDVDQMQTYIDTHLDVKKSLNDVGFGTADAGGEAVALLSTYAGQAGDMKKGWTNEKWINRDINLRLQFLAGMYLNQYIGREILQGILGYYRFPDEIFSGTTPAMRALKQGLLDQARPQAVDVP
jgi:spermidine synthase